MTLLITYEQALVPDGGVDVCCSFALAQHSNKDAAGHAFHQFALLQAGVIGEPPSDTFDSCANTLGNWRSERLRKISKSLSARETSVACCMSDRPMLNADACAYLPPLYAQLAARHQWLSKAFAA